MNKDAFNRIQQNVLSAWHKGDVNSAFSEVEVVLREGTPEMKGQILFFRGMIFERTGRFDEAKRDWIEAISYSKEGSFLRYELETSIGAMLETRKVADEALSWYRSAILTCVDGGEFSGHEALAAFKRLCGPKDLDNDFTLLTAALEKSWRVLQLPGNPSDRDLAGNISKLSDGFATVMQAAKQPPIT